MHKTLYEIPSALLATALVAASFSTSFAKTFDVDISTGRPAASNEAYYHGETIEFRAVRGRSVVTNIEYASIYYQTNGMGNVWWRTDGLVFHPTNDVGAASYRFFMEGRDDLGRDWHANGLLRLLPSPGFEPNTLEHPLLTIDFAAVDVVNAPYYDKDETDAKLDDKADITAIENGDIYVPHASSAGDADHADYAEWANGADTAISADGAWSMYDEDGVAIYFEEIILPATNALAIARAATATNAQQTAALASLSSLTSLVSLASAAATNYTDSATNGLADAISDAISDKADASLVSELAAEVSSAKAAVAAVSNETSLVYRLYSGSNVVCEVTNYNSRANAPTMRLLQLDTNGVYSVVWAEANGLSRVAVAATNYADSAVSAAEARAAEVYAPRGWSETTSGLGSDAPPGTTWLSTPTTVISGGFEYEKVVTSAGAVWVLCSNGMAASMGPSDGAYFKVAATDGTELFSIEKTDSYLVGVSADGITKSGNTVTVPVNVSSASHPFVRATTNIVSGVWAKEDGDGFSCPWATVSWGGGPGAYVATITCAEPSAFFCFEFLHEGSAKVKNSAPTELSGGIIFNGTTYLPTVNGSKLEFVAP